MLIHCTLIISLNGARLLLVNGVPSLTPLLYISFEQCKDEVRTLAHFQSAQAARVFVQYLAIYYNPLLDQSSGLRRALT